MNRNILKFKGLLLRTQRFEAFIRNFKIIIWLINTINWDHDASYAKENMDEHYYA